MSRIKIKINKVSNLTDARYFAAMGADYLGFCCNTGTEMYCSPQKIKEITDWVEGPAFVFEFDGWQDYSDILSVLNLGKPDALHLGAFATYEDTFDLPVFKDFILENLNEVDLTGIDFPVLRSDKSYKDLNNHEKSILKTASMQKSIFLDININARDLNDILSDVNIYGIILRGGEEERVGFKSFEELDDIFDMLG
jgi:phosphoribosylanthranilate isomerase